MLYDRNGKLYTGPVNYDMGGPRDYYGNYLSYEAPRPRPISQPSGSSRGGGSIILALPLLVIANFLWDTIAGIATLSAASFGAYKASKWALSRAGHKRFLRLKSAGISTATAMSLIFYGSYNADLKREYPYIRIQLKKNGEIYVSRGLTAHTTYKLDGECGFGFFASCKQIALLEGGAPGCIGIARDKFNRNYYHSVFYKGEDDSLLAEKENFGFYAVASHLSGQRPNFSLDRVSKIHYFCNNSEMSSLIPEWERRYDEVAKIISDLKKEPLPKKSSVKSEDIDTTTRPANAAAIAADPSIQPIFDETVTPAAPSESPALRDYFRVTASMLNIREGAGTNNGVEGKLARGSCVSVERGADDVRGFLEIMAQSANGTKIDGYVSAQYLSAIRPAPAACVATFQ